MTERSWSLTSGSLRRAATYLREVLVNASCAVSGSVTWSAGPVCHVVIGTGWRDARRNGWHVRMLLAACGGVVDLANLGRGADLTDWTTPMDVALRLCWPHVPAWAIAQGMGRSVPDVRFRAVVLRLGPGVGDSRHPATRGQRLRATYRGKRLRRSSYEPAQVRWLSRMGRGD